MANVALADENMMPMQEGDFLLWQRVIEDRTGLWLPKHRKTFLLTQLLARMREQQCASYRDYYDRLLVDSLGKDEWAQLVDLLTVHETRFFRDEESMQLVINYCHDVIEDDTKKRESARSSITRDVLSQRKEAPSMLQVWSVGCASGEEVYSLAMAIDNMVAGLEKSVYFGVTGSDISFPSLAKAREGRYPVSRVKMVPEHFREAYFEVDDNAQTQIIARLKERVYFVQGNLGELEAAPLQAYNVIYCQNVLIYFKPQRKERILEQLVKRLTRGGLLVLAPGEVTNWQHPELDKVAHPNCLAYIKRGRRTDQQWSNYGRK